MSKNFKMLICFILLFFTFSCKTETSTKQTEYINTNELLVSEEKTKKPILIILPFESKVSETTHPKVSVVKSIINGSLSTFLKTVPSFDFYEDNISNISYEDVKANYNPDIIIYGDITLKGNKRKPDAEVNIKIWNKLNDKTEEINYSTKTDADMFDTIDEMLGDIVKITLNEELKIAHINFNNFNVGNASYTLFINNKILTNITEGFNYNLKVLANREYHVKIQNNNTKKIVFDEKFLIKSGEKKDVEYSPKSTITLLMTNKLAENNYIVLINGNEINLGKPLNFPAEKNIDIIVKNKIENKSYTMKYYPSEGEEKTIYLPLERICLTETDYKISSYKSKEMNVDFGSTITNYFSENFLFQNKKSLFVEFNIIQPAWMGIELLFNESLMDWSNMNTLKLNIFGTKSQKNYLIQLEDKNEELFVYKVLDNWDGWKELSIPISKFESRSPYQKNRKSINKKIDYPLKTLQFEIFEINQPQSKSKLNLIIGEIEVTKE